MISEKGLTGTAKDLKTMKKNKCLCNKELKVVCDKHFKERFHNHVDKLNDKITFVYKDVEKAKEDEQLIGASILVKAQAKEIKKLQDRINILVDNCNLLEANKDAYKEEVKTLRKQLKNIDKGGRK